MHEIVVISGKGGTGKTSLTAAFAHLAADPVLCDLDVDAQEFFSGHEAVIDPETCNGCGLCHELCRYGAVAEASGRFAINPLKCEGCKVCVHFCPLQAIRFPERHCGRWFISRTRFGPMVHAQLLPGAENSGRLVALLREKARDVAERTGRSLIIADGSPGIGCPVISSLTGAGAAILVTEPTPSGIHDLERVADLCRHFKIPAGVIVNKADLNPANTKAVQHWCESGTTDFLGALAYDAAVTEAMVRRLTVTEFTPDGISASVRRIWKRVLSLSEQPQKREPIAGAA